MENKTNSPRRLQSLAPASLEIEAKSSSSSSSSSGEYSEAHAPIPLLLPLVLQPSSLLMENVVRDGVEERKGVDGEEKKEKGFHGCRHPALTETAPDPAGAALAHCLNVQQAVVHVSTIRGDGLLVYVTLIFVNLFF
ncbi:hypothetical protein IHE45_09G079400 [Dioscorea alata]|uniref:Uncharacterized protein n=1 Tax=Dioscorea alata TaxID=55571 RepID=A0ACB7VG74_DIOAL|nr:hypothetical protein IHE45_09G079400 [Dioscorea alata]